MKTLCLLSLFFAVAGYASPSTQNPVRRYFQRVPIERAHNTIGSAQGFELESNDLKVLIWNVKKGMKESFTSEFVKHGEKKDIFLIQEAYTADFFRDSLASFSHYQWDLGISFTYRLYNNDGTGNMIGSWVKPTWVKVEHSLDLEPVTDTPKTTAYAKYRVNGKEEELLVISIHGINFANLGAYERHLDQVKKNIQTHHGPVIFAGDFNTRTKRRFAELLEMTHAMGLQEVKFVNGDFRMRAIGTRNILDHAFVRGFDIRHAEVFKSDGSDHRPMTINLQFL
jgi:endonuclease/exonuclease/phosphatase (EEP) superfamily protein YafD